MTAYPDHTDFVPRTAPITRIMMRPKVTEHYWGYEIGSNTHAIDVAVFMRALSGLLMVATFIAAFGIWLMPASVFETSPFLMKVAATLALLCLSGVLGRIASRGTHVRMQIDTANGELREVVDGQLNTDYALAHYGMDTVEAIEIIPSLSDPIVGQIQVTIKGVGAVPVGDGAIATLRPLLNRMASDCGIETNGTARPAVWTGPIAA